MLWPSPKQPVIGQGKSVRLVPDLLEIERSFLLLPDIQRPVQSRHIDLLPLGQGDYGDLQREELQNKSQRGRQIIAIVLILIIVTGLILTVWRPF
jgi:hypothetical protein